MEFTTQYTKKPIQKKEKIVIRNSLVKQILLEIRKAVNGKDTRIYKVLLAIIAGGHILLEDIPGVGKTTLALALSRTMSLSVRRIQFTPDVLPSDVTGFTMYDKSTNTFDFKKGAAFCNLLLADEINRTSSKTQSALLEAMEEKQVTVDGHTHALPTPFVVLATQNPVGSAGTQLLPTAQLDRFLVRLSLGYPDRASQVALMRDRHIGNPLENCRPVTDAKSLEKMSSEAMSVHVADSIYDYVSELAEASRKDPYVLLGISPRGALAVCRAAKANAYLDGRDYVIPADVAAIFSDVAAHRMVLSNKAKLHEHTAASIADGILRNVKRPDVREFSSK